MLHIWLIHSIYQKRSDFTYAFTISSSLGKEHCCMCRINEKTHFYKTINRNICIWGGKTRDSSQHAWEKKCRKKGKHKGWSIKKMKNRKKNNNCHVLVISSGRVPQKTYSLFSKYLFFHHCHILLSSFFGNKDYSLKVIWYTLCVF